MSGVIGMPCIVFSPSAAENPPLGNGIGKLVY